MRKNDLNQSSLLSYSGKFSSLSYLCNFSFLSYSGLSRVSRGFKWILGTSPRMTIKNVCPRMTPTLLSYSCLTRVSMGPRNKSEDDCSECISEDDKRECVLEGDCYKKMSPRMTIMMWILVSSLTMTNMAQAECTPAPDCANMGYTETSCNGDSLKCPFDISKLFCIPCDSSYKYDCNGDNMTGGVGDACGGKYASCACSGGGVFNNGSCPKNCTVGMIYYSDKSCSSSYDSSKTAIGVVVKDNALVLSQKKSSAMKWASNTSVDTSLTNITSTANANVDYNGKSNTAVIVAAYPSDTSSNNAAIYCNTYTTAGTSAGDWYLPAAGELYSYVYGNYNAINTAMTAIGWTFGSAYFWSSSERSNDLAWGVGSGGGYVNNTSKDILRSVSCLLAIN